MICRKRVHWAFRLGPVWSVGNTKLGFFTLRLGRAWFLLRAPWDPPLFSERYGYLRPRIKLGGWRFFSRILPKEALPTEETPE